MWWNKYIGLPFEEKGRSMNGVDCWGLVKEIYKNELGMDIPGYLECYETTNDRQVLSILIEDERKSAWTSPVPGTEKEFDVVILRMRGLPMHVGIVTTKGHMLHCTKGVNTTHEKYKSMRWNDKVMGFARHK